MSILGLLLAGVAVRGTGLDVKVTLSLRAMNLKAALEQVSEATNQKLIASKEIQNQTVSIKVKDRPLSSVMSDLAKVTHSEIEDISDGYKLTRPAKLQKELENKEYSGLERRIKMAQDAEMKAFEETLGDTDLYLSRIHEGFKRDIEQQRIPSSGKVTDTMYFPTGTRSPGSLLMGLLFASIDPAQIARMKNFEPVVYAYPANRIQIPLGASAANALQSVNRLTTLIKRDAKEAPHDYESSSYLSIMYFRDLLKSNEVAKAILIVNLQDGRLTAALSAYDKNGKLAGQGFIAYSLADTDAVQNSAFAESLSPNLPKPSLSKFGQEYRDFSPLHIYVPTISHDDDLPRKSVPADLMNILKDADKVDPLSALSTDLTWQLAEIRDRQLIASIPDNFDHVALEALQAENFSWKAFVGQAEREAHTEFQESDGVLLISPSRPIEAENSYLNRPAIAKFFREGYQKGLLDMRSHFKLEYEAGFPAYHGLLYLNLRGIARIDGLPIFNTSYIWPLHRLLGSFSDMQYGSLLKGGSIGFVSLSMEQKNFAQQWTVMQVPLPYGVTEWQEPTLNMQGSELLASVSPSDLMISLGVGTQLMLRPVPTQNKDWIDSQYRGTLDGIAGLWVAHLTAGDWKSLDDWSPNGFYASQAKILKPRLDAGKVAYWELDLEDSMQEDTEHKLRYADLPAEYRKELENEFKKAQERRKSGGG